MICGIFCLGLFVMFHFDWVFDIPCLVSRQNGKKRRGSSDIKREFLKHCHFLIYLLVISSLYIPSLCLASMSAKTARFSITKLVD